MRSRSPVFVVLGLHAALAGVAARAADNVPSPAAPAADAKPAPTAEPAGDAVVVERVVAVVDNAIVLSSEVEAIVEQLMQAQPVPPGVDKAAVVRERRAQILDTLIAERLLESEVKKLRIDVTAAEVDRIVLQTMRENNLTDETLKMALARQNMTLQDYKDQLKKQLTKMKIVQIKVKSRVNVDDAQVITAKKQQEKAVGSVGFSRVKARHILWLVPPGAPEAQIEEQKKKAVTARGRLDGGADFAEMAAAESEDPGSKTRGGDLGAFGRGEMVPEFERAAFAAPVGKVVGPVRTQFGWHLIIVDEHVADAPGDPDKALDDLRQKLYEKEIEVQFQQYIEELKRDAFIEKRL